MNVRLIGESAAVGFVAIGTLLHFLRRDVPPVDSGMSHYALGRFGWLMQCAFLLLVVSFASAAMLRGGNSRACMITAAAGLLGVVLFPSGPRAQGFTHKAHRIGAMLFFAGASAGVILQASSRAGLLCGMIAAILFVLMMIPPFPARGLLQRCCFLLLIAGTWML